MNGRAYDYNLGRFLSVDPFIQAPGNSQSMNPYSYIMNNPLAGTDPSGYIAFIPAVMWAMTAWGAAETAEAAGEMAAKYELDEIDGEELAKGVAMSAAENTVGKKIKIAKTLATKARQATKGKGADASNVDTKSPKADNGKTDGQGAQTNKNQKTEEIGSQKGNSRKAQMTQAKKDAKVPRSQQPEKVEKVKMRDSNGDTVKDSNGNVVKTTEYTHTTTDGNKVVIQDHSAGHKDFSGDAAKPHIHVRPAEATSNGTVEGTKKHYVIKKKEE